MEPSVKDKYIILGFIGFAILLIPFIATLIVANKFNHGASNGTITDMNGHFSLELPDDNAKLQVPCALGVRTDDLIFDKDTLGKDELLEEITLELDGCSKEQLLTRRQILSSSKEAIQKYLER